MTDDGGERLYIHTVFQRGGGKSVAQIMELNARQTVFRQDLF